MFTCWWHRGDAFGPRSTRRFAPHRATLRGVSALRVTIAIANAHVARKQRGFASQLPSRGYAFAMNRPPADVFGQALLEDPPQ
jgi:hypothetical protein